MKKVWLAIGILFTFYLLLPGPKLPPPGLPGGLKSTEPGDTVQIENLSAYFTNKDRKEVVSFYEDYFSHSGFLNIPLPTLKLNHRPEYAKRVIKDTIQTYYFEELVHPFRESLFINGFDWQKDVFTSEESKAKNKLKAGGQIWQAKATLYWFPSNVFIRTGIFWLAWGLVWFIGKETVKELKTIND